MQHCVQMCASARALYEAVGREGLINAQQFADEVLLWSDINGHEFASVLGGTKRF
jgi:hypothetical protein